MYIKTTRNDKCKGIYFVGKLISFPPVYFLPRYSKIIYNYLPIFTGFKCENYFIPKMPLTLLFSVLLYYIQKKYNLVLSNATQYMFDVSYIIKHKCVPLSQFHDNFSPFCPALSQIF